MVIFGCMLSWLSISTSSDDCVHFELEAPDFSFAEETIRDMEECSRMWSLYEEWLQGFTEKAKEDWITFRYGSSLELLTGAV